VVSVTYPYGRILGFLVRGLYFFFICIHEAEWNPYQTNYFSENLVTPGIESGPLDMKPGTLTARPQRRSTFFYITYTFRSYLTGSTYISVV
jgi:hypothetical protein